MGRTCKMNSLHHKSNQSLEECHIIFASSTLRTPINCNRHPAWSDTPRQMSEFTISGIAMG